MTIWEVVKQLLTNPIFAGIVNVLSLAGIFLAWRSWKDGQKLSADTTQLSSTTAQLVSTADALKDSLSTVHVGVYPTYLPKIEEIVSAAIEEIRVMSVIPGFGCFSAPDEWESLSNALVRKQNAGVLVTVLSGTPMSRERNYRLQFADAFARWGDWLLSGKFSTTSSFGDRMNRMCKRYAVAATPKSGDEFIVALDTVQEHLLQNTYFNAKKRFTDDSLPVVAWIVDRRRAVFAISNARGAPSAFYTHDKSIVEALSDLADRL